jgi:YD repeat-containing protein
VNATDNIFVLSRSLEINGSPVPLVGNEALFTAPVIGDYTAVATATDPTGNVGSDTVVFSAVDPATDEEPPEVAITSPAQGSDITSETTFVGTATDLALTEYRLMYRRVGTADFTTFHVGTRAVEDDVLGTLDTSALENGLYDIRLEATDINGLQASVVQVFTVVGEFKPGIFTISYTDLEVPVSGIGITINRTYDSRRRSLIEDFGNGWNLEVFQDGTYTNNRALGDGWFVSSGGGFFNPPCSISNETKFHITEIRFSDTEFYKFAMDVEFLGWGSAISGGCDFGEVTFIQIGGVPGATLEIVGSNEVFWGGGDQLLHSLLSDRIGELFEGEDVRLTTLDGRVFDLNLTDGLQRIGDLNGNSVFINDNGVVHSDGTAVFFARDGAGRITRITDPSGEEIVYAYDGDGNLSTVDDRNGSRTAYFYVADNYLERIVNPEGNIPLRNEYDASGLLVAQVDGMPESSRSRVPMGLSRSCSTTNWVMPPAPRPAASKIPIPMTTGATV